MQWTFLDAVPEQALVEFPDIARPAADALFHRGITSADGVRRFLNPDYLRDLPDPFLFFDMERTVARLYDALEKKEPILIHGDYDADGICATAILASVFRAFGGKVLTFLPTRHEDGYGVSTRAVEQAMKSGVRVLITADCGIAAHEPLARATAAGIDVIITDHHRVGATVPDAFAILHPLRDGERYPDQTLTGGGVALKLAQGLIRSSMPLHRRYREGRTPVMGWEAFEKWLLDLAAISTIADCSRMVGESRAIVSFGLIALRKTLRPGLRALYARARIEDKPLTEDTIRFSIAPRINATGRLRDPKLSLELLLAEDTERAERVAGEIEALNTERQQLTHAAVAEVQEELATNVPPMVFAYREHWNVGLISLLASRFAHQFARPAFVLAKHRDELVGSARGVDGFDCVEFLEGARSCLKRFGGHTRAAGFTLAPEHYESFRAAVSEHQPPPAAEEQNIAIDSILRLNEADQALATVVEHFAPFGEGNSEPIFVSKGLRLTNMRRVGKSGSHLQAVLTEGSGGTTVRSVGFGMGDRFTSLLSGLVDVAFHLRRDTWNGNERVQAVIVDMKHSNDS